jgi:hypothetical protein
MKNPYDAILPSESIRLGKKSAWALGALFLAGILVLPVLRNVSEANSDDGWVPAVEFFQSLKPEKRRGIAKRLRDFETKLGDNADFAADLRRVTQARLTDWFGEGSNRTVIGKDGWLFFRPALQALTGYGPIKREPRSVAKDPSRPEWRPALEAIVRFSEQLHERDIELVLVPAPVKPMIYPEHLGAPADTPVRHQDSDRFFKAVRDAGVEVIDMADTFFEMKADDDDQGSVFLKQDTHWHPRAMAATTEAVAKHLQNRPWFASLGASSIETKIESVAAHHIGDLVEKLDFAEPEAFFAKEEARLVRVLNAATGEALGSDLTSPIVILGDSFVNVFDDPGLGFAIGKGEDGEPKRIGAGFAQTLAQELHQPLDVIAINGQAATGVRETFARRYEDEVRTKKAVVWIIAARDLFLSETPANGLVRWDHVTFNPDKRAAHAIPRQGFAAEGTIRFKSELEDPSDVPYPDCLYVIEVEVDKIVSGRAPEEAEEINVVLWAFRDRKYLPESNYKENQRLRLSLVPWETKTKLQTTNISNDSFEINRALWFAEEAEVIE